ncbi:WD40/YVTN/BNR-like repeat-containing protein [Niastella sp. OAS944]|uniref:WD40/YVTN/BNR-like repeat-containing protein n=1 Tax=Niastella sp. OAS944 TaxID=2664089 RepID=UPI00346ECE3C|nr:hypothetical protein [Chitinophagaceae bacterium OAS944]
MKTPVWLLIIALIIPFNKSSAQTRDGFPIVFSDSNYRLALNKNNQLAVASEGGKVAAAKSIYGVCRKELDKVVYSPNVKIKNTNYFNGDTVLVTETLYRHNKTTVDLIYRTIDGGKNWEPVTLGFEGTVDDAVFLNNGVAWICVAGEGIAYTKDYGASWTNFAIPLINTNKRNHYSTIYFNNKRTGILSSQAGLENQLAYTRDNCKHWTIIATPYSQLKYKRANDDSLKEINRVAIYRNYILVSQENQVFYSRADKIQWVPLSNYKDFYTDAENNVLFLERKKGGFVKCDSRFNPVMAFNNITNYSCAVSENGSLYVLGKNTLWQINRHNRLAQFPLYTNINAKADIPVKFGHIGLSKPIAHIGNNIYQRNDSGWEYLLTLPFATGDGNLSLKEWETIVCTRGDSVFYYNMSTGKVTKVNGRETINNFATAGIKHIIFTHTHFNCARSTENKQVYTRHGNEFITTQKSRVIDTVNDLPQFPHAIGARSVEEFLKKMPAIYAKQASINDMAFNQADYDSCKIFILKYQEKYNLFASMSDNPDLKKIITLVDSVKTINRELLNWYFLLKSWSTAGNSTKITFVNNNNEELEIKNEQYFNSFYFPWYIKLNGLYIVSTAIEINQFLQAVHPNFLDEMNKLMSERRQVDVRVFEIQRLVRFLYMESK